MRAKLFLAHYRDIDKSRVIESYSDADLARRAAHALAVARAAAVWEANLVWAHVAHCAELRAALDAARCESELAQHAPFYRALRECYYLCVQESD